MLQPVLNLFIVFRPELQISLIICNAFANHLLVSFCQRLMSPRPLVPACCVFVHHQVHSLVSKF